MGKNEDQALEVWKPFPQNNMVGQASSGDTSPASGLRHEGEEWKAMLAAGVMKVEHERLNVKAESWLS